MFNCLSNCFNHSFTVNYVLLKFTNSQTGLGYTMGANNNANQVIMTPQGK